MPFRRSLLLAALLALPLAAEDPAFRVEGGLAGHVREDRWTYARIDARGGDEDFQGVAVLASKAWDGSEAETLLPIQVPRKSRKRFEIYHRSQGTLSIDVRVFDPDGNKLYDEPLEGSPMSARWLVGVLGPSLAGLDGFNQIGQYDINAISLGAEGLPRKSWGLDALDWLLWPEPDPQQLLPEQAEAIVEWVRSGGRLCLCIAKNVDLVKGSPFAALLPGSLERAEPRDDLDALKKLTKVPIPAFESALIAGIRPEGKVLLSQDDRPLAVRRRFGLGQVVLLAFDPLTEPFTRWTGRQAMWIKLLGLPEPELKPKPVVNDGTYYGYDVEPPDSPPAAQVWVQRMESAPLGRTVDAGVFVLLFVSYVLIVGVGDYLWWKRKGKPFGLWLATPVWVALFGYLSFQAGTTGRRKTELLRSVTVYDRDLTDKEWTYHGGATAYVGSGQRLSFAPSPAPGVLWPTAGRNEGASLGRGKIQMVQTPNGTEARGLKMYSASMVSFLCEGRGNVPELSGLRVSVQGERVTIENKTAITWVDGWLLRGKRCCEMLPIAAGATEVVDGAVGWLTAEEARDRTRNGLTFPQETVYYNRRSYYYETPTEFRSTGAHIHALQLLLEPWSTPRRWEGKPGGFVPDDLSEPCLLLVANGGPCGVSIDPFEGERVGATAVRIWLDEETPK